MSVQLGLLTLVLHQVFSLGSPLPVLALAAVMTVIAGGSAVSRIDHRYAGIYPNAIFSVWASTWVVTGITIAMIVQPTPWHDPKIVIPLIGMVLGNSLTGISLGMDRFLGELTRRRDEVEMLLSVGATRWEACRDIFAGATRTALIPILNTMSVAGIVSIPGMMTGQLLAGAPPVVAVQYQVMIMFVIAAAIALGVFISLALALRNVTSPDHRIQWDRMTES